MSNDVITTVIVAIFASSGFWAFVTFLIQSHKAKKTKADTHEDLQSKMLKGLGHDRIIYLGTQYINRGYITPEEYESLYDYLYIPYRELGGNGTAEKIMNEVKKLPSHDHPKE